MTDYNDGKWHEWNGGDCPVHKNSVVEGYWRVEGDHKTASAVYNCGYAHVLNFKWDSAALLHLFRVVDVYVEPKTIWVNEYPDGRPRAHITENGAKNSARDGATRIAVEYREVRP